MNLIRNFPGTQFITSITTGLFVLIMFSFVVCDDKNEKEALTPDLLQSLTGDYRMTNFQVHFYDNATIDSFYIVQSHPKIHFATYNNLNSSEMRVSLREFLAEIFNERINFLQLSGITTFVSADLFGQLVVGPSNTEFKINNLQFDLMVSNEYTFITYQYDFKAHGSFYDDQVEIQFTISNLTSPTTIISEGKATGKRK